MASSAARSASRTASSTESRSTPGIDSTGARVFDPSMRNSGQIRSCAVKACSRTRRRAHSALRLRRGRLARSSRGLRLILASTGASRASIGRPYLMAIGALRMKTALFSASATGPLAGEPSFRRGAREFDEFGPFRPLALLEGGEILRRAGLRDGAEADEILLHFRRLQAVIDGAIERVAHVARCAGRRDHAGPGVVREIGKSAFDESRYRW